MSQEEQEEEEEQQQQEQEPPPKSMIVLLHLLLALSNYSLFFFCRLFSHGEILTPKSPLLNIFELTYFVITSHHSHCLVIICYKW